MQTSTKQPSSRVEYEISVDPLTGERIARPKRDPRKQRLESFSPYYLEK